MTAQPRHQYTPQEYLSFERGSDTKHEYYNGEIYAMVGASEEHNTIVTNTVTALRPQLRGKNCRLYASDMRVKVRADGLFTYPDVVMVCGEREFEDKQGDTLLNPTIIIEVLSHSTQRYDRTKKFESYAQLHSLQEYLLIAQENPHIEQRIRQPDSTWRSTDYNGLDASLNLSIGCELSLSLVYEDVELGSMQ